MRRPRVRSYDGHELALPTWTARRPNWLSRWAMNLMLINVSTRKLRRAVRLPEGDLPAITGDGTSKSAANIFPRLSVWENIRCAVLGSLPYKYAFWHGIESLAALKERTVHILHEINLVGRRDTPAGVLTYAEQRALEIGITIAGGAGIILLDEPTAGMSRREAEHVVALIRKISAGRTLVIIEHDMGVVFDLADRISVLVYGQIIASDAPARIKANAAMQQAYLGTAVA
jgi:branched-chain amino acid transport system ATP-binding protein